MIQQRELSSQDRIITLLLTIDSDRTISLVKQVALLEHEITCLKEELHTARSSLDKDKEKSPELLQGSLPDMSVVD